MSVLLFPGQGSQNVGMGLEFYENFPLVKNIFKQADEELKYPLSKIIIEGPAEELQLTKNTQPAILTVSYSIFRVLNEEFGIEFNTIKSSEYKDSGSPFREMTEDENLYFQDLINDLYEQFVEEVSNQRDIPITKVKDVANGKIFSGKQALEIGLIDTLGTLNDAIEYLKVINKYNEDIKLVKMPNEEKSIFDFIFNILSYKLEPSNENYTIPQYLIVK